MKNQKIQISNEILDSNDKKFMKLAIKEAQKALKNDEVPVGCVIAKDDKVVAKGYNKKEKLHCSVYHAEIVAIEKICKKIGDWRLNDGYTIYVTMEPCAMCAGAIINHRIKNVVIGITEPNFGACGSGIDILNNASLNTKTNVKTGVLAEDCKTLLQSFFEKKRKLK
ncbi:MAG TPA: tRNA-specific adenosine deaminase [Clostridiales bacterium]|nr:tRNA-specific adenosine deaminase [Clostridiales bacterium]